MRKGTEERFWAKVDKSGPVPPRAPHLGPCWLWTASIKDTGYGQFRDRPRTLLAHRVAYELLVGLIPEGLTLDHLCRTPACVNPVHLEPVTNRENILRGTSPAAHHARKTHCIRGHVFDAANTYLNPSGKRQCRACLRQGGRST